jgi:FkbM family methyltransferase
MSLRSAFKKVVTESVTQTFGDAQGMVTLRVLKGPARGLHLRLDLIGRQETAYWLGKYEIDILRRLQRLCRPGWTVWDCGTYLGFYTAFFARLVGPGGVVVAFEPDPNNLDRTRANAALNRLENVRFVHAAIGPPVHEAEFVLSGNTNSHLPGCWVGATRNRYSAIEKVTEIVKVPCLSLDDAFYDPDIPRPDLVKLDIEGSESTALQFAHRLAREGAPMILLELHNPECDAAAWDFSRAVDYTLETMEGRPLRRREEVCGTILCRPRL